ncbi:Thioredoxin [uncultured archaeon]|nr:Thioredoxin [uncultured archaeon]
MQRIEEKKKEKEEQESREQKAKKKDRISNYLIIFLVVAVVAAYAYISSNSSASEAPYYPKAENNPAIGPADAPIQIIAFGDMSCPYTKHWVETTFDQLMTKYDGKIRFVFRDFPKYDKHPQAQKAAEAAECANDQGKYWEYFRKVFAMQPSLSIENLKQYAVELGLDSAKFNECLDSGKYTGEVKKDHSDGAKAGVVTTPTFFINDVKIDGDQPLSAFDSVIGQLMK